MVFLNDSQKQPALLLSLDAREKRMRRQQPPEFLEERTQLPLPYSPTQTEGFGVR